MSKIFPIYYNLIHYISFLLLFKHSVSFRFGIVAMISGIIGVPAGSMIAQNLRSNVLNCDPLICAFSLIGSMMFIFPALIVASLNFLWTLFFVFLAEVLLNFTWSLVADMLLVSLNKSFIHKTSVISQKTCDYNFSSKQ